MKWRMCLFRASPAYARVGICGREWRGFRVDVTCAGAVRLGERPYDRKAKHHGRRQLSHVRFEISDERGDTERHSLSGSAGVVCLRI